MLKKKLDEIGVRTLTLQIPGTISGTGTGFNRNSTESD
jgi:hypothetical protein